MQTYTSISASFAPVPTLNLFKNSHYSFVVKEQEKLRLKKKKKSHISVCLLIKKVVIYVSAAPSSVKHLTEVHEACDPTPTMARPSCLLYSSTLGFYLCLFAMA